MVEIADFYFKTNVCITTGRSLGVFKISKDHILNYCIIEDKKGA